MARQAIAIIHPRGGSRIWLNPLLKSIDTDYDVFLTNHKGWCMDGIEKAFADSDYDEILFMNETMLVKDNSIWDIVFDHHVGRSVALGSGYLMFFGKYLREHTDAIGYPKVKNKLDDVYVGEVDWNQRYMRQAGDIVEIKPLYDTNVFVHKNGRKNMVLENDYFIKWKGTWSPDMITLE